MKETKNTLRRKVEVEFLYLDLTLCHRCRGTEANLREALSEVAQILEGAGAEVTLSKMKVESEAHARGLGFITSPTIRINGRDIALEFRESRCGACETVAGVKGIDCRVWLFQGKAYTEAPKPMILDAILREVYGVGSAPKPAPRPTEAPENLRTFFAGKAASSCCAPVEQVSCCAPSEKAACCGINHAAGCGCEVR